MTGNFLGSPVVKTPCFHCRGHGLDPLLGKFCTPHSVAKKKKRHESVVKRYGGLKTGILKKENWGNGREALFQDIKDDNFLKLRT